MVAPKPIIKTAVLQVLGKFSEGLVFSELRKEVEKTLVRTVHDAALNYALKSLIKNDLIEKKYIHNDIIYSMCQQPHKQTLKDFLTNLAEKINLEELEANFALDKASLPNLLYLSPFPDDEHEVCDKSNFRMSVSVDWSDPKQAISSIVSNDFLLLPSETQNGIANLIFWSYWVSLQEKKVSNKIEDITMPAVVDLIKHCKSYASNILEISKCGW